MFIVADLVSLREVSFFIKREGLNEILMHLQMQRDVWLNNVINLRQYILRYTVGTPTSLRNVAFHWLASE